MGNWVRYNANPKHNRVGDCAIRCVSKVLDIDWDSAFALIAAQAYSGKLTMDTDASWEAVLYHRGFRRQLCPDGCPGCYSLEQFCEEHPEGSYAVKLYDHVVAVVDGRYFDTWDSGDEIPIYYWHKEEQK